MVLLVKEIFNLFERMDLYSRLKTMDKYWF